MNKNLVIVGGVAAFIGVIALWTWSEKIGPIEGYTAQQCFDEIAKDRMLMGEELAETIRANKLKSSQDDYGLHNSPEDLLPEIKKMPELPGYYHPNLREILANDDVAREKLLPLINDITQLDFIQLFMPENNVREKVREIIFIWYGVDAMDPASRGPFIDARELSVVEIMTGEPFLQLYAYPDPAPYASGDLKESFDGMLDYYYATLLVQVAGVELLQSRFLDFRRKELAEGDVQAISLLGDVNAILTQRFDKMFTLHPQGVRRLTQVAAQLPDVATKKKFWQNVVHMSSTLDKRYVGSNGYRGLLQEAIQESDENLTLDLIEKANARVRKLPSGQPIAINRAGDVVWSLDMTYYYEGWRKTCYKTAPPQDPSLNEETRTAMSY